MEKKAAARAASSGLETKVPQEIRGATWVCPMDNRRAAAGSVMDAQVERPIRPFPATGVPSESLESARLHG